MVRRLIIAVVRAGLNTSAITRNYCIKSFLSCVRAGYLSAVITTFVIFGCTEKTTYSGKIITQETVREELPDVTTRVSRPAVATATAASATIAAAAVPTSAATRPRPVGPE